MEGEVEEKFIEAHKELAFDINLEPNLATILCEGKKKKIYNNFRIFRYFNYL